MAGARHKWHAVTPLIQNLNAGKTNVWSQKSDSGWEGHLTGMEYKEVICADGNALYLVLDKGNKGVYKCQNSMTERFPLLVIAESLLPAILLTSNNYKLWTKCRKQLPEAIREWLNQTDTGRWVTLGQRKQSWVNFIFVWFFTWEQAIICTMQNS